MGLEFIKKQTGAEFIKKQIDIKLICGHKVYVHLY